MSAAFWVSLVLAGFGIAGIHLAGKGRWYGWLLGFLVQPVWIVFAIITEAYGLVLTAIAYAVVYGKNVVAWRRQVEVGRGDSD